MLNIKKIFRIFKSDRLSVSINVIGLVIGIASATLISLWLLDEYSWDRFHNNHENMYRIVSESARSAKCPIPLGPTAAKEIPEINSAVSLQSIGQVRINHERESFYSDKYLLTDANFFEIFNFSLELGDSADCLNDQNSVVITENLAKRLFGNENPIGEGLMINGRTHNISAVAKNPPHNSHIQFEILIPIENMRRWWNSGPEVWDSGVSYGYSYITLREGTNLALVQEKINSIMLKNTPGEEDLRNLQPMSSIRLHSDLKWDLDEHGSATQFYLFALAAILIIVIATINFMSLNMAIAIKRFKEIAVRKICGANKWFIFRRFINEYLTLSIAGLFLGLLTAQMVLPLFNSITSKNLGFEVLRFSFVHVAFLLIVLAISIISAMLATKVTTGVKTINSLKDDSSHLSTKTRMRKGLVLCQFALAISLMISFIAIQNQIKYLESYDLGYSPDNLIYVRMNRQVRKNYDVIVNDLKKMKDIVSVSRTDRLLLEHGSSTTLAKWPGKNIEKNPMIHFRLVDDDFLKTHNMKLVDGNFFTPTSKVDFIDVVLNENAVKLMGLKDPIGKEIKLTLPNIEKNRIIGVVKDFNYVSLHNNLEPMALLYASAPYCTYLLVKTTDVEPGALISQIKNLWNKYSPQSPFIYGFMDQKVTEMYSTDSLTLGIISYFAVIGIFLSNMGLLSLAIHTISRRKKEIGIRKVLGAQISEILYWLNKDFAKLVLLANVIAWPLSYYAISEWLASFAYRVSLSPIIFIVGGVSALVLSILTVSFHSIKASNINPVDAIRYE